MFWKKDKGPEFDRELRFHIEAQTEDNIRAGMTPEEARRQAVIDFGGGTEPFKEELRDVQRTPFLDTTLSNLKVALRQLRKAPGFALTIILTLALGIGANTAVFSAIDAVLLRPLPFVSGDSLTRVLQGSRQSSMPPIFVAPVRLEEWNRLNSSFEALTGYYTENASETSGTLPERVVRGQVSPRFLQVWGLTPALGRDFNSAEQHWGGPNAALITDRYWRTRFHSDPAIVGKLLRFGQSSCPIVGVLPPAFEYAKTGMDLLVPIPPDAPFATSREASWYTVIGRRKPGVSLASARHELNAIQENLGRQYPKTDSDVLPEVQSLKDLTVAGSRSSLWLLFGAVSVLLLIACTNIAALLLARSTQRQHEIAVRFSLGASRKTVVLQLLMEAFVLASLGAMLGAAVAAAALRAFKAYSQNIPRLEELSLDWRIVTFTLICTILATVLCALFPALRATRTSLAQAMMNGGRSQTGTGSQPLQWALVGIQVALAVTLLTCAGLLARSFQELGRVTPGFETSNILTLHVSASWGESGDFKGIMRRIDRTLNAIRTVPGVEDAATSGSLPGVKRNFQVEMKLAEPIDDRKVLAENTFVSANYFSTMRIPVLAGEACRAQEPAVVALVNRSFVDTYGKDVNFIGRHLSGNFFSPGQIKGVVANSREQGLDREPVPTVYWCSNAPTPDPNFLIRTHGDPAALANALRLKIREVSPARSVFDIRTLDSFLQDDFSENRLRAILLTFFAFTAIALASIGLYGTLSYLIQVRRREVGLRIALGALPSQIVQRFLMQGLAITAVGCLAGLVLAMFASAIVKDMLYGVSPQDPRTFAAVAAIVFAVATLACLRPAIRAARFDPIQALRDD